MKRSLDTRVIRILLIGPLPPPMGGATRHFLTLQEDLGRDPGFRVKLINTSRQQGFTSPVRNIVVALKTLYSIILNVGRTDIISFHASDRGMFRLGPTIVGLCKLAGKPIVLRIFGGSFGDFYERQNRIGRWIIRKLILSSNVVLLQTHRTIRQLQGHSTGRLEWFSTYVQASLRPAELIERSKNGQGRVCQDFIFLGHLWRNKGLEVMLDAAPNLPGNTSIDIYGPLDEYTEKDIQKRGMGRVRYGGFLTHSQVGAKLCKYDCLVLPTFHPSEGYPGVIAEAFTLGLPVITTNWLSIPEIVDDQCGILIPPRNTAAFVAAIEALHVDRALWRRLCQGARIRAAQFDHKVWSRKFESICEELLDK